MLRRTILAGFAGLMAGIAGCTETAGGDPTDTQPAIDGSTPSKTRTSESPVASSIAYEDLSQAQQNAFDQAQNETVRFGAGIPSHVAQIDYSATIIDPFREHDSVRKGGSNYELQVVRATVGRKRIDAEPVDDPAGSAIQFDDLSGDGVDTLRQALTDGSVRRENVTLPPTVEQGSIITYNASYYRISVRTIDYTWFELTVEAPSSPAP